MSARRALRPDVVFVRARRAVASLVVWVVIAILLQLAAPCLRSMAPVVPLAADRRTRRLGPPALLRNNIACAAELTPATATPVTAAQAIVSSPRLRRLAGVLLRIKRTSDGDECLLALADHACAAALNNDIAALDTYLRQWSPTGATRSELLDALADVAQLFNLSSPCVELEVQQREGNALSGKHRGCDARFSLVRSPASSHWSDEYSAWEIADAFPATLRGLRIVACKRGGFTPGVTSVPNVAQGDRLIATSPDQAAIGDIILYDFLPDRCDELLPLLRPGCQADDADATDLLADAEISEAAEFALQLEKVPSASDRLKLRLQRLSELPLMQEVFRGIRADDALSELSLVLQPCALRIYSCGRAALDRQMQNMEAEASSKRQPDGDPFAVLQWLTETLQSLR